MSELFIQNKTTVIKLIIKGGELSSLLLCRAFLSSYSIISLDESCNNLNSVSISFLKVVVAQEMKERIVIIADHGHGFEQFADYVIQFQEPEKLSSS